MSKHYIVRFNVFEIIVHQYTYTHSWQFLTVYLCNLLCQKNVGKWCICSWQVGQAQCSLWNFAIAISLVQGLEALNAAIHYNTILCGHSYKFSVARISCLHRCSVKFLMPVSLFAGRRSASEAACQSIQSFSYGQPSFQSRNYQLVPHLIAWEISEAFW